MAGYKFPLQKLLDIRVEKEEHSKRVFMQAQRDKDLVELRLNEMQENYDKYNVINKEESIIEQKIKRHYLNALTHSISNATEELEEKKTIVEKTREDLKEKQIDRKTVEILKEKKQQAYIKEQNRVEQVNNDEFALYSYIRRNNERG